MRDGNDIRGRRGEAGKRRRQGITKDDERRGRERGREMDEEKIKH